MNVVCEPGARPLSQGEGAAFSLFQPGVGPGVGRLGWKIPTEVRQQGIDPDLRAWDLLSLSLGVVAADQACSRSASPDGWTREIDLSVALVDPDGWRDHLPALEGALRFLTGDIWHISVRPGGGRPLERKRGPRRVVDGDCACLLSGGVDSLVGAIDAVTAGRRPVLVSQRAKGDTGTQVAFAKALGPQVCHLQLSHAAWTPLEADRTQRSRSLIFLAFGVLAATALPAHRRGEAVDLLVPENGFISLNVPLTPLRFGSLSTRTTHPYFLGQMQEILDAVGFRVRIVNPYQFATKGEMLAGCKNRGLLRRLVPRSTSCGRFARWGFQHCGRCLPCLVRRAAFLRWGQEDRTEGYRFGDLSIPDHAHRDFDDVRSAACAVLQRRRDGVTAWGGGAFNSVLLGDVEPYLGVAERGIDEIAAFLEVQGAL